MATAQERASRSDCDRMLWSASGVEPAQELPSKHRGDIAPPSVRDCDGCGTVL